MSLVMFFSLVFMNFCVFLLLEFFTVGNAVLDEVLTFENLVSVTNFWCMFTCKCMHIQTESRSCDVNEIKLLVEFKLGCVKFSLVFLFSCVFMNILYDFVVRILVLDAVLIMGYLAYMTNLSCMVTC